MGQLKIEPLLSVLVPRVDSPSPHRVREIWLQVEPEEPEGNHRHDADDCGEYNGEPHCGLGQRVLGIPWG